MENSFDFVPVEVVTPKRGPEPLEHPSVAVEAVESAKAFAAEIVRPEPIETFPAELVVKAVVKAKAEIKEYIAANPNAAFIPTGVGEVKAVVQEKVDPRYLQGVPSVDGNVYAHDLATDKRYKNGVEEPEVAPLDVSLLSTISTNAEIAEALAAEGLEIDQVEVDRVVEDVRRKQLETVLSPSTSFQELHTAFAEDNSVPEPELAPVTPEAIHELKIGINASFEEVASLLLEHQRQIDEIEVRLAEHNKRGGHKI